MKKTRLRSNAFSASPRTSRVNSKESNWDIWLQRLSHISQFGIFLFTVWAIYFTVIPLYQKALLDEAIARKEIELNKANKSLRAIYIKTRPYLTKDFSQSLSFGCSPYRQHFAKREQALAQTEESDIFKYEILSCIKSKIKSSKSLVQLNPVDRMSIIETAIKIGDLLEEKRIGRRNEFQSVEVRAKVNPDFLPPPGEFIQRYLDIAGKFENPTNLDKIRLDSRIEQEKSRIALDYSSEANMAMISIQDIRWPKQ